MTNPDGAFYSTQDADSEGVEGQFFVWSRLEIEQILGPQEAELFCQIYDVTSEGNWEGHNILHLSRPLQDDAKLSRIGEEELRRQLQASKQKLFDVRSRRVWPGRDDKILTAWNGLMIGAFAQAGAVLDNPAYLEAAGRSADFLLAHLRTADGLLRRTSDKEGQAKINAYLEDYSFLIDALVSLYEGTFAPRWIEAALQLTDKMIEQFWDPDDGGFSIRARTTNSSSPGRRIRTTARFPSGNSMAVTALLRLGRITGRRDLLDRAEKNNLRLFHGVLASAPLATRADVDRPRSACLPLRSSRNPPTRRRGRSSQLAHPCPDW